MSILKNFVNPWESTGELGRQALRTEALEGNVVDNSESDEVITREIATERTNLGKSNLMLLFCSKIKNYDEVFSKKNLETDNELWDYFVTYQNLYDVLSRVKKYQTKHSNILLQNVVIYSHGRKNAINIENTQFAVSSLYGTDVKGYMNGNLDSNESVYKAVELLEFIADNMLHEGNILFLACSAGIKLTESHTEREKEKLRNQGEVSIELAKFYSSKGKTINLYFNKDLTDFGKDERKDLLGVPWGRGLSTNNTGWKFIQTNPDDEEPNVINIDKDITLLKESIIDEMPYIDLIKQI